MDQWIDLNDLAADDTRQLARTLCERRIAQGRKQPLGNTTQSERPACEQGMFSPDTLYAFAAGVLIGAAMILFAVVTQ